MSSGTNPQIFSVNPLPSVVKILLHGAARIYHREHEAHGEFKKYQHTPTELLSPEARRKF